MEDGRKARRDGDKMGMVERQKARRDGDKMRMVERQKARRDGDKMEDGRKAAYEAERD